MKKTDKKKKKSKSLEIHDYDHHETLPFIKGSKQMSLSDLGLKLPEQSPTEVISIRLPRGLLNQLRSIGSERDMPYQALIKYFLSESISKLRPKPLLR